MVKICLDCLEHVSYNRLKHIDCKNIIEVDELIAETILILNRKGYKTMMCCSGHLLGGGADCWVTFDKKVVLDTVPNGFKYIKNEKFTQLTCHFDNCAYKEVMMEELFTANMVLLKWAISLKSLINTKLVPVKLKKLNLK